MQWCEARDFTSKKVGYNCRVCKTAACTIISTGMCYCLATSTEFRIAFFFLQVSKQAVSTEPKRKRSFVSSSDQEPQAGRRKIYASEEHNLKERIR